MSINSVIQLKKKKSPMEIDNSIYKKLTCCIFLVLLMSWAINMAAQKRPSINRNLITSKQTTTKSPQKTPKKSSSSKSSIKSSSKSSSTRSKSNKKSTTNTQKNNKGKAYFDIEGNKYDVTFDADGGTEYFYISTNTSWKIDLETDNWGHLYRNGNTLTLVVDPNNSTVLREDYFVIGNAYEYIEVYIHQKGRKSISLSSSTDHLKFSEAGGTQTLTVYSNSDWHIGIVPDSWCQCKRSGNQLIFTADPNNYGTSRTDYFTIVAGDKSIRINITQDKKEKSLWLSNDEIYVSSMGDTKYITVDSEGEYWEIGTNTNSWGHLSKSGNTLTLKVDPNRSSSTRTDYFTVKSGNNTKRVDITQYGAPASSSSNQSTSDKSNYNYNYDTFYENDYDGESWWKGRVSLGVEIVGSVYGGSNFRDMLFYSYGAGLILRFGKYSDFLNFSTGCKWMRLGYDNDGNKGNFGNHLVVPGNLKFNLFYMGASKSYIGGGFEYGFGLKKASDFMDWNIGIGVNSRHIDWYLFYKQLLECNNTILFDHVYKHHIGTSLTIYF